MREIRRTANEGKNKEISVREGEVGELVSKQVENEKGGRQGRREGGREEIGMWNGA